MSIEVLLVQFLILAFTAALWWIARRDLAARVPPPVPAEAAADMAELEQLCATLEALVTSLARRLEAVERQAAARPAALPPQAPVSFENTEAIGPGPQSFEPPGYSEPLPDPRYAPVYALLESGVSDPVEIARQTGLGRGEVDLILSLRSRRAF